MNCNSIIGKVDMLKALVHTYKPDLISLTETKIDKKYDDNELLGSNYTVWRNDRKRGAGVYSWLYVTTQRSQFLVVQKGLVSH